MSLLVSLTAKALPSFEVVLFRGAIQAVLGIGACRYLGISPWGPPNQPKIRFLLICRGLAGSIALALFFFSLSVMPLADATVIFFLGPTFTAILARLVLKETFGLVDALASIVSMVGVVLVSKPSVLFPADGHQPSVVEESLRAMLMAGGGGKEEVDDRLRLLGAVCAAVGAMFTATAYLIVRIIGKERAHSMQHVVALGVVSCLVSPIGLYTLQGGFVMPQGWAMWIGVLALGILAFLGQILLNNGLQMAPLGPGTLMRMNDIVFAFFFQITVQHETPDLYSCVGAFLVMLCTAGMGLNKWRLEKLRIKQQQQTQP
ncbi:hypothetical protein BGX31_011537 [Mortierella sp. GBA43]|nr:hypothetical protein BGX31_011537 [Mortierella sp. GBA43]